MKLKEALLSPLRLNLEEDTALKTNYYSSSNGKVITSPFKMQNLEDLALGLPEDPYLSDNKANQLMDVEEVKREEESEQLS